MKIVLLSLLLLTGCTTTDQCLRRELFNECMGQSTDVYQCNRYARFGAQREYDNIRENCK